MTVEPRHLRLMGIAEAAEYANVHPSTLRRRIADGQLPAYRVGPKLLKVDNRGRRGPDQTRPGDQTPLTCGTIPEVHPTDRG
jgi:excisionase family DNA binding protein